MKTFAVILAAGKGTRMKSVLPKVLHSVSGKPMVQHLVDTLHKMKIDEVVVVVGHKSELVREQLKGNIQFVEQTEQNGTAHAVLQAAPLLQGKKGNTLILTGDTPLIEQSTLEDLISHHVNSKAKGTVLTALQDNPTGYGRIIRENLSSHFTKATIADKVLGIVEEKDATPQQKEITEVNTGIFCIDNEELFSVLPSIQNNNVQNEYYLTDIVSILNEVGKPFEGHSITDSLQVMGINDRVQLSVAEQVMRDRVNHFHMLNGVTLIDVNSTYIDIDVQIGADTIIYPNVVLKGNTKIGSHVILHNGTEILDADVGDYAVIKHSFICDSVIGKHVQIGPFAHIRPDTIVKNHAKIGNFVELKNTTIGEHSKVNHLSYLGDAEVGSSVNVGCGSITVNYDGTNKHKTTIKDGSFIGCNVNLIAPVTVEENSFVAAGSTITTNVPKDSLAIARTRQENKKDYIKKRI